MASRAVLVTGASTGIGEATVQRLDRAGFAVYAGVRSEEDGERLAGASSDRLTPVLLDVTDRQQIDAVVKRIAAEVGSLAGVVNNAGIAMGGPLEYLPLDEWRFQFEVNVFGLVAVTQAAMPLIRSGGGRIVLVGSVSGRIGTQLMGPYDSSKHAVEGLAESLRQELKPWNIKVVVIEPGAIATAIWGKGRDTADRLSDLMPEEAQARYGDHIEGIRKGIEDQEKSGISPDVVAQAIEHALTSDRPRHRYLVGTDAKMAGVIARFMPDKVKEVLIRKLAGP
jgi:NAD(P)-dependent dehydrogenase (short-subunit alcohol dehydrogenase family)